MLDFLEKYNEANRISENLFGKIFGKKDEKPEVDSDINNGEESNLEDASLTQSDKQAKEIKQPNLQFERNKVYEYDLTKIPILGKFSNPISYVSFKSPDEFKAFKAILFYLNNGYFDSDIHNIRRAIKYGEIDGFGDFTYLSPIFNNNKGLNDLNEAGKIKFQMPAQSKVKPVIRPKAQASNVEGFSTRESMRRLEKFVKYFIENIVDINGRPNQAMRKSIILRLKKLIGKNIPAPRKVSAPTQVGSVEPGAKPEDIENGDSAIDYAIKGLKESVRDIIKKNF
jgi:hypothetical protein